MEDCIPENLLIDRVGGLDLCCAWKLAWGKAKVDIQIPGLPHIGGGISLRLPVREVFLLGALPRGSGHRSDSYGVPDGAMIALCLYGFAFSFGRKGRFGQPVSKT